MHEITFKLSYFTVSQVLCGKNNVFIKINLVNLCKVGCAQVYEIK